MTPERGGRLDTREIIGTWRQGSKCNATQTSANKMAIIFLQP